MEGYLEDIGNELNGIKVSLRDISRVIDELHENPDELMSLEIFLQKWAPEISLKQKISIEDAIIEASSMYYKIFEFVQARAI